MVNRAHRRTISAAPKRCLSRGAIPTLDVAQGLFGGAMSDPSPIQAAQLHLHLKPLKCPHLHDQR